MTCATAVSVSVLLVVTRWTCHGATQGAPRSTRRTNQENFGPLYDQEGTLYADHDVAEVVRGKFDLDVVGHYARPHVLRLIVNRQPALPVIN